MNKIDLDKITNHEIKIYVDTASKIMQKCLEDAKLRGAENVFTELSEMIDERFDGTTPDAKFLRNLHDKIKKLIDPLNPGLEMVIYERNILALATIAGIGDYKVLKQKYQQSLYIPVMYTPTSWNFFSFIRVPCTGVLRQAHSAWEYSDDEGPKITGNVINVTEFTMPGDRHPLWLQVKYITDGKENTAYFAEYVNETISPIVPQSRLLLLFQKLERITAQNPVAG